MISPSYPYVYCFYRAFFTMKSHMFDVSWFPDPHIHHFRAESSIILGFFGALSASHKYSQRILMPWYPHWMPNGNQKKTVETQDWSGRASSMQRIGCQRCCVQLVPIHLWRRLGRFWTGRAGTSENHGKTMGKYGTIHDTVRVYSWENHRTKWWILQLTMFDCRYLMICH